MPGPRSPAARRRGADAAQDEALVDQQPDAICERADTGHGTIPPEARVSCCRSGGLSRGAPS